MEEGSRPEYTRLMSGDASEELADKMQRLVEIKEELDDLKNLADGLKTTAVGLEEEIFDAMESLNMQNVQLGNIRLYRNPRTYFSVKAAHKAEAYQWLRDNGLSHLVTNTVNSQTLGTEMRKLLEEGGEVPQELINVNTKKTIGVRRS